MRNDTEHLLSSTRNAGRLREAVADANADRVAEHPLIDIAAGYERAMRRFPRIIARLRDGIRD